MRKPLKGMSARAKEAYRRVLEQDRGDLVNLEGFSGQIRRTLIRRNLIRRPGGHIQNWHWFEVV